MDWACIAKADSGTFDGERGGGGVERGHTKIQKTNVFFFYAKAKII